MSSTALKKHRKKRASTTSKSRRGASKPSASVVDEGFTVGSDNVFEDLGFSKEESRVLAIKADLAAALTVAMEDRGITQEKFAKKWGKPQPRVSEIVSGKLNLVSIDTLVGALEAIGVKVVISVPRRSIRRKAG